MDHSGFLSLLPPLLAVILAIATRQVYVSLLVGIVAGEAVLMRYGVIDTFFGTLDRLVEVFADPGNTRTIIFCTLVGALIVLMQRAGGVAGFINAIYKRLEGQSDSAASKRVQLFAWVTGIIVFVESSISVLTVGTLFRPLFDRLGISREKLAYIADSSSAPVCILIPLNAWGAFVMGLLLTQGVEQPLNLFVQSMAYAFYPIAALMLVPLVIYFDWEFGSMRMATERVRTTGELLSAGGVPMTSTELTETAPAEGIPQRAANMLVPIGLMVFTMPIVLAYTGWEAARELNESGGFWSVFLDALGQGSGSTAVLAAVSLTLLFSILQYGMQRLLAWREMIDLSLKGLSAMLPLALLMMFAFAISSLCRDLGTGIYVAGLAEGALAGWLAPTLIFVVSGFIAFSTGTSWGTFAIMVPIALPVAAAMGLNPAIGLAAALGGGVFGDHCSPISDTTILASMAAATDHVDHVRTQLPYALIGGAIAIAGYLIVALV